MSTDAFLSLFDPRETHEPRDPMKAAQGSMRNPLPQRFYAEAKADLRDGLWRLLLDGRGARTPARHPLAVENSVVAAALADEWQAQAGVIDPATMPLTRLVNAALDGVAAQADAVRAEIVRYGGSDLICYRADAPAALVERQAEQWDPLAQWASSELGLALEVTAGLMHVAQPAQNEARLHAAVAAVPAPLPLAALSLVTTLTGSAIIALALARGRLDPEQAWIAAHLDEDYQAGVWGLDDEAVQRLANRRRDFDAAALVLANSPHGTA